MAKKKTDSKDIISGALTAIRKKRGDESITTLNDSNTDVKRFSSGLLTLDKALGGGYPVGRIIEILGMESSGKSSLALHAVAKVQSNGGIAAYIDVEHAFDKNYAEKLGVDISKLIFAQPTNGEEALGIMDDLINYKEIDLVVLDSVDALQAQCEIDGDVGDAHMGVKARMMSQAVRKFKSGANISNTTLLFINQLRDSIGFSSGKVSSGGNALKFYASLRLDVRKFKTIKEKEIVVGQESKIKVIKNKVAPPGKEVILEVRENKGFYPILEIANVAITSGIIKQSGSWFSYGETKLGQGKNNVLLLLEDNSELVDEITKKVKEILK